MNEYMIKIHRFMTAPSICRKHVGPYITIGQVIISCPKIISYFPYGIKGFVYLSENMFLAGSI